MNEFFDYEIEHENNITSFLVMQTHQGTEWLITEIVLCIIIILAHITGSYTLLRLMVVDDEVSVQHMLVVNASVTEISGTTIYLVNTLITHLFDSHPYFQPSKIKMQVEIVIYVLFTLMYSMNLTFITIDRLMYVVLGIKYDVYWTTNRTKILISCMWVSGVIFTGGVSLALHLAESMRHDFERFVTCFYLVQDFVFVVVAAISYTIMFHIFKKTRRDPVPLRTKEHSEQQRSSSNISVLWNSKFRVSALLVLNFFLLVVLPDIVLILHEHLWSDDGSAVAGNVVWILFLVSHISDAFIYLFTQQQTKMALRKKMARFYASLKGSSRNCAKLNIVEL